MVRMSWTDRAIIAGRLPVDQVRNLAERLDAYRLVRCGRYACDGFAACSSPSPSP
jgi:hypothetical protein